MILIKNGLLYTMVDEPFVGDILIRDGKIAQIGKNLQVSADRVIDAKGNIVMPGLIDAHSHIGLFDFNTNKTVDEANEMTHPVSASVDARYSFNPQAPELKVSRKIGVTTMLFTPGSGDVFCGMPFAGKTAGRSAFEMCIKAPAAVKIALGGNPKNTFGERNQLPMTRMGVAKVLFDTFERAKRYLEKKAAGEDMEPDADLEAIIPALQGKVPCKVHCTQYDMLTAIEACRKYGVPFSLEHCWGATDYIEEIVESGCDICYGPIGTYRSPGERRKIDIEAVRILDARGVNVSLITDSPVYSEESLYHHMGEAVRSGVPWERVLRMVTLNPAKHLMLEDRIGSLKEGLDGDVLIVAGRIGLDTDARVLMTLIDGEVVFEEKSDNI